MQSTPYDILGVRPGASGEEVEHAYRARRSQYHPDRYSQSDDETQRWATQKMQEVTAAYRAITEGAPFIEEPEPAPTTQPQAQPTTPLPDIESLLRSNARKFVDDRIFLAPNIPPKKLDGALTGYGFGLHPRDILVVVDNTVFGSAKDGLLVSREGICFKESPFSQPVNYQFSEIESLQLDKHTLYINGYKQCWLNLLERRQLAALIKLVEEYLFTNRAEASSPQDTQDHWEQRTVAKWKAIRQDTATRFAREMGEECSEISDLFTRIEDAIAPHFGQLVIAASEESRANGRAMDHVAIERALLASLALIGCSASTFPGMTINGADEEYPSLLALVLAHADEFANSYRSRFGSAMKSSQDELLMAVSFFAQDEESWQAAMKLPRQEALRSLLMELGFSRQAVEDIVANASRGFTEWLKTLIATRFNQYN